MAQQKLESMKYWEALVEEQHRLIVAERERKAIGALSDLALGAAFAALIVLAISHQDKWLPMLQSIMHV